MNISLKILGVASAMPISDRNPSAQVLNVHGRLFLIDCGEGTQRAMRREHLSFVKVEAICISHIHGDHVFGIFGMLSTMAMLGRTQVLHVYAPEAFGPILKFYLSYWGEGMQFEVVHHPLKMKSPQEIHLSRRVRISAFPLRHKIDCYGFRFDEIPATRRMRDESTGEYFRVEVPPVSYAYCSDTEPFEELSEWVRGVSVLYHEATYTQKYADKARKYHHSTAAEAASCAARAGVGKLLVGHYSSRVRDIGEFEREARSIFPMSFAAEEGDVVEIC